LTENMLPRGLHKRSEVYCQAPHDNEMDQHGATHTCTLQDQFQIEFTSKKTTRIQHGDCKLKD